jgi:hypothetical protein
MRAKAFWLRSLVCLRKWLGCPLVLFDVDAVGLREHFDPLINWLLQNVRCTVLVAIMDPEFEIYQDKELPKPGRGKFHCIPKSQFPSVGCVPAVSISFHPENGSALAQRFEKAGTQRIVMQHGLSEKVVFSDRNRTDPLADFDVVFLVGPIFRAGSLRSYCERHPDTCRRLRFMEIGLPKTDALFKNEARRESVLGELGLDQTRPTVCYAPTWEKWASLEQHGVEIIEALASMPINVIVKLHHASLCTIPYDWIMRDGHGGKSWSKIIGEIASRRPNLKLAAGQDAMPYLIASDLLVSDASGIAYEFVLLDRPVVFFDVPDLFAAYGQDGIHFWGRECGDIVKSVESLADIVMSNLKDPDRKREDRQRWIPRISYSRGDATEKAGKAILSLMQTPQHMTVAPMLSDLKKEN